MLPPDPDRVITLVQSSTKNIMNSFRGKTELLRQCHKDIKLLIREDYDRKIAYESALRFFGKNRAKFIAIDGTKSQDQELDVLVFYAGAFGYIGQLEFSDDGTILYVSETQLKWYFTVYSNRKTIHIISLKAQAWLCKNKAINGREAQMLLKSKKEERG
jgi:hypothetical protein